MHPASFFRICFEALFLSTCQTGVTYFWFFFKLQKLFPNSHMLKNKQNFLPLHQNWLVALNFSITCLLIYLVSLYMAPIRKTELNVLTFIKIKSRINVKNINKKNKFGCTDCFAIVVKFIFLAPCLSSFCLEDSMMKEHFSSFIILSTVILLLCNLKYFFVLRFHASVLYVVLSLIFLNFPVAYTPAEESNWWWHSCITDVRVICFTVGL